MAPSSTLQRALSYPRQLILLSVLFAAVVTGVTWSVVSHNQRSLIEFKAIRIAEIAASQAVAARSVYSELAVSKLKRDGFGSSAHSDRMAGFVPLPAEFFRALSRRSLADSDQLYRFTPISRWNVDPDQGVVDDFQTWAWSKLEAQQAAGLSGTPTAWKPIWRIDERDDGKTLRYLRADPAASMSCVNCHNAIEADPAMQARRRAEGVEAGHRFSLHDLLGAVQIEIPLDHAALLAQQQTRQGLLVVGAAIIIGLVGFAILVLLNGSRTRLMTSELNRQARRDSLTGLPNRFDLDHSLAAVLADTDAGDGHAVLLLDLDDFKRINDSLGHEVGDEVLKLVGQRLVNALRAHDIVSRLGGDEFVVILPDADRDTAGMLAQRLSKTLQEAVHIDGHHLSCGASIGIAMAPENGAQARELLRCADVAMYVAKQSPENVAFYDRKQDDNHVSGLTLVQDLREAIAERSLTLHFQPQYCLHKSRMIGVEALLRWDHPTHERVPPDRIVALAERHGLIGDLTHWVLHAALAQCRLWHDAGFELSMAVNLSALNLHDPSLAEQVHDALIAHDVPPTALVLEVTESAMMVDPEQAERVLNALRGFGVALSVDDYGTGYSSLSYLRRLPVQELKLDRSFLVDVVGDEKNAVIVKATLDLAHNLGLSMVAEGVEDAVTLDHLQRIGCDVVQGYFLGRPVSAADLTERLPSTYRLIPRRGGSRSADPASIFVRRGAV